MNRVYVKTLILIIFNLLIVSCNNSKKIEEAFSVIEIDETDIGDLNKINDLIFRNMDLLMDSCRNHYDLFKYEKDDPERYTEYYFTSPTLLRRYLPAYELDNLDFIERHESEKTNRHFYIRPDISFRPIDSVVSYEIKYNHIGNLEITHILWFNIPESTLKVYTDKRCVFIELDDLWTYVIYVYENIYS